MLRQLFICHGKNHDLGKCRVPMHFSMNDVYENRILTADISEEDDPDIVLDITTLIPEDTLDEMGRFDIINARCCPAFVLYDDDDGWIVDTFMNVARLLNDTGQFITVIPPYLILSIANKSFNSKCNDTDYTNTKLSCEQFLKENRIPLEVRNYNNTFVFDKSPMQSGGGDLATKRFLATLNSLHKGTKQFRSVRSALGKAPDAVIDVAFNVLSVSEGLREACLVHPVPARWKPPSILNVHMHRLSSIPAVFITRHPAPGLAAQYDKTRRHRPNPKVERAIGKWLGYIHPCRTTDRTGTVVLTLTLPGGRVVPIQYGPQEVSTSSTRLTKDLDRLHRKWDAMAKRLHPECAITMDLRIGQGLRPLKWA